MTIKDFITRYGITFEAHPTSGNPNMQDMPAGSRHYVCRFGHEKLPYALSTYYSMGPALEREPTAEEVLDCLASDAAGWENASGFEDWAGEYGYDTDSRRAERIYVTVGRAALDLKNFLGNIGAGDDTWDELLYETERS